MNSQNNEEEIILTHFKEFKGRFLDVGAYDGITFSNTFALAALGWAGVCIEPAPSIFGNLLNLHYENKKIDCVNAALATRPGLIKFYDDLGGAVATTSELHKAKWHMVNFRPMYACGITMDDVINTFGGGFDMINLDVEGTNIELLKTIPLDGVKLICVEYDGMADQVIEYCKGFREISRNGENIIMAR